MLAAILLALLAADVSQSSPTRLLVLRNPRDDVNGRRLRYSLGPPNLLVLTNDAPVPEYLRDYAVFPLGTSGVLGRPRVDPRAIVLSPGLPPTTTTYETSEDKPADQAEEDSPVESDAENIVYPVAIPFGGYAPGWQHGPRVFRPQPRAILIPRGTNIFTEPGPEATQQENLSPPEEESDSPDNTSEAASNIPEPVVQTIPLQIGQTAQDTAELREIEDDIPGETLAPAPEIVPSDANSYASPYLFGYIVNDGQGSVHHRQESANHEGVVTGSYGYRDSFGLYRIVNYIADDNGFRVKIKSNEPGMDFHNSERVLIDGESVEPAQTVPVEERS